MWGRSHRSGGPGGTLTRALISILAWGMTLVPVGGRLFNVAKPATYAPEKAPLGAWAASAQAIGRSLGGISRFVVRRSGGRRAFDSLPPEACSSCPWAEGLGMCGADWHDNKTALGWLPKNRVNIFRIFSRRGQSRGAQCQDQTLLLSVSPSAISAVEFGS